MQWCAGASWQLRIWRGSGLLQAPSLAPGLFTLLTPALSASPELAAPGDAAWLPRTCVRACVGAQARACANVNK